MVIHAFYEMLYHFSCKKGRVDSQPVVSLVSTLYIIMRSIPANVPMWSNSPFPTSFMSYHWLKKYKHWCHNLHVMLYVLMLQHLNVWYTCNLITPAPRQLVLTVYGKRMAYLYHNQDHVVSLTLRSLFTAKDYT